MTPIDGTGYVVSPLDGVNGAGRGLNIRCAPKAVDPVTSVFDPEQLRRCVLLLSEPREPEIAVAGTASQRLLAKQPHHVAVNASRLAPHLLFAVMTGLQTGEFHVLR